MATNPDSNLILTSLSGHARSLDDWQTMFHLCLVILPDQPDAVKILPAARSVFATFGDADCRTAFVVPSTAAIARRILGDEANDDLVLIDPDKSFVNSLGLTTLPALVHLRQDSTVASAAEGWNPSEWHSVAKGLSKAMAWSTPSIPRIQDLETGWGHPVRKS